MFVDRSFSRVPVEIRIELVSGPSYLLTQLREIVAQVGVPGGNAQVWLQDKLKRHSDGELMIIAARVGRLLVGFMMLEQATMTASYSWVVKRFRNRGLGMRFYSFACINLGAPAPCFVFPRDMREEYASALRNLPIEPANDPDFCAIHPSATIRAA